MSRMSRRGIFSIVRFNSRAEASLPRRTRAFSLPIATRLSITSASPRSRPAAVGSAVAACGTGGTRPGVAVAWLTLPATRRASSTSCSTWWPFVYWSTPAAHPGPARRWTDGLLRGGVSLRRSFPDSVSRCWPDRVWPAGNRRPTSSMATATWNWND